MSALRIMLDGIVTDCQEVTYNASGVIKIVLSDGIIHYYDSCILIKEEKVNRILIDTRDEIPPEEAFVRNKAFDDYMKMLLSYSSINTVFHK